jgi:transposase-like protein
LANPPAGSDVGRSDKQLTIINSGLFIVDGQPLADLLGQGQSANEQLDKGNVCRSTTPKAPTSLVAQPRSFRLAKLAKLNQLPGESQPLRRQASNGRRAATPENSSRPQSPIAIPQPAPEPLLTNEEARADVAPRLGTANDTKLQAARRQASNDRRATTPENSSRPQSPITISQPAPEPLFLPIYEQARADKEPRFVGRASGTNSPSPDPPATAATAPSRTAIEAGMPISVMKQAARQAMKQSKQSNAPVPQSPPPAAPLELLSPDLLMAQADAKLQRLELLSPADLIGQMNIK